MARSDLLIALLRSGGASPDPRFKSAAEALIAEERAKRHTVLADRLAGALAASSNGRSPSPSLSTSVVTDLVHQSDPESGLADLILPDSVAEEFNGLIEEHNRSELLRSYGLSPRHRILLIGPPGNGKTSVASALAHDLMVPLITIRYDGLIGSYLGETASRLNRVFEFARQRRCVLFFDEFDTVGKERGDVHETGEIKRVVSTLLLQMDQLPSHVVIVTATNHAELLDRAVWRRFEIRLELPRPNAKQINEFVSRLFAALNISVNPKSLGLGTRLSGATYSEIEDLFRDVARRIVLEGAGADPRSVLVNRLKCWKNRATVRSATAKQRSVNKKRKPAKRPKRKP